MQDETGALAPVARSGRRRRRYALFHQLYARRQRRFRGGRQFRCRDQLQRATVSRLPNIEVRVGSYDFDNTGHIYSGLYSGSRYDTDPLPLDDNYRTLREGLWLATDHAYKAAVESIARKRAALTNAAAPTDKLPDYSQADRCESLAKITRTKVDEAAWTESHRQNTRRFSTRIPRCWRPAWSSTSIRTPRIIWTPKEPRCAIPTTWPGSTRGPKGSRAMVWCCAIPCRHPRLRWHNFLPRSEIDASLTALADNIRALAASSGGRSLYRVRRCSSRGRRRSFWRNCSATICTSRANRCPIPTGR